MFSDVGRFVGRYFQALACFSIASMIISVAFFDSLNVDFSVILLLWAGALLVLHNPTARKWTIGILGVVLTSLVVLVSVAIIVGTETMILRIGGSKIEHPSLPTVMVATCFIAVLTGIPFALLLTPKARKEFDHSVITHRNGWAEEALTSRLSEFDLDC